jgi:orotidine-5'-phosphate decarboxylase
MPVELQGLNEVEAFRIFCGGVLDAVAGIAVAVKFQSACFERLGSIGVALLGTLRQDASDKGLQIILDAKRGDIGISAAHYAAAATVEGPCDWITVNPYLGIDGIEPFLDAGLGVFCLARTSNPSGDAIQLQQLKDGTTVAESIAELLAICGDKYLGNSGWSSLGAVVGATKPKEAVQLRAIMRKQIFLMPGIGAQGASVKDVSACFSQGHGALVTASRSVIYPPSDTHWQTDIANAAKKLSDELQVGAL